MPYGDSRITIVTDAIINLITANQDVLGINGIYLGDQNMIPKTPTVCVVPSSKGREFAGAPLRTRVTFQVFLMVYQEKLQDTQANLRESMTLTEAIEALLHQDISMGGICQSSMVEQTEPGFAVRSGTLMRCTRMTWTGMTVMIGLS
jgi:hypothetical protein